MSHARRNTNSSLHESELMELELNMLGVYCQRVSESEHADPPTAEEARRLKKEWVQFIFTLKDNLDGAEPLKQQMIDFLARCSVQRTGDALAGPHGPPFFSGRAMEQRAGT